MIKEQAAFEEGEPSNTEQGINHEANLIHLKIPLFVTMATNSESLFSVTIFGYRKPGMDEDFYHKYVSETHANHLKDLLLKNKIVSYHMVCPYQEIFLKSESLTPLATQFIRGQSSSGSHLPCHPCGQG